MIKALDAFTPNNSFDAAVKECVVNSVVQRSVPGRQAYVVPGVCIHKPAVVKEDVQ